MPLHRRALALLVVLGVLGVMTILALAFVSLAQLERRASQQRTNASKAFFLARSGLEDALARLGMGQDPALPSNRYAGEDWDASGSLEAREATAEAFRRGILDTETCPVTSALRPSFWMKSGTRPDLVRVDGRERGLSGRLAAGSHYALKVIAQDGFFVNGGDPAATPDTGYNAVLKRMLGVLAEALDRQDGSDNASPMDEADGLRLINDRPAAGWKDLEEISRALGWSEAKTLAIGPYLCFQAWTDKRVIAPHATDPMAGQSPQTWAEIVLGRAPGPSGTKAPDFERIGGHVVGRAPVNLLWAARHKPALIALTAGLSGLTLNEWTGGNAMAMGSHGAGGDVLGTLNRVTIENTWSAGDDCHRAADFLAATWCSGEPSWQTFESSLQAIPFNVTGTTELQAKWDVLKANFNPNSDLNKFNPDRSLWRAVDKSDLTRYSTELCFDAVQGVDLECTGRILGTGGRILSQCTLRGALPPPGVVRISTQREFVCDDLGSLDRAGDEGDPRLPGHPRFVTESRGLGIPSWGHRLDMSSTYPGTWMQPGSTGTSVQSYPEPCHDAGGGPALNPADYDGCLKPATIETRADEFYGGASLDGSARTLRMLGRFGTGLDLDLGAGIRTCVSDENLALGAELGNGLLHPSRPVTLLPDGAYSEKDRCPGWHDRDNTSGLRALLSFWVKNHFTIPEYPAWDARMGDDSMDRGRTFLHWSNYVSSVPPANGTNPNQFFWYGITHGFSPYLPNMGTWFETGHQGLDAGTEYQAICETGFSGHRWHLHTLFLDFLAPEASDVGIVIRDDGNQEVLDYQGSPGVNWAGSSGYGIANPVIASDITQPDVRGAHRIYLGLHGEPPGWWGVETVSGKGADATFDEFGIWDFGGAGPDGVPAHPPGTLPFTFASRRWKDGRYYKGSVYDSLTAGAQDGQAASWLSAPIALPAGSVVRRISWTLRAPPELSDDFLEIALADTSGADYLLPAQPGSCRSASAAGPTSPGPSWTPGLAIRDPFRLQAVFRRLTPVGPDTPILDAPALDDLTVVYLPPGGPRLLSFEER